MGMKMECSPETSFFDGLMNKLAAEIPEEGVSHKILEVFRGIEDSIKGRAAMTNDDLRHTAEEAVAIRDEITGMLSSESGVRRDVLDLLNSRIEILQNKRQPLSGEEIAFRLEDVGMKAQSKAFRQTLAGASAHQGNMQDWLSGLQTIQRAAQSLHQLETTIDTRACKIGGAYLLNQWMINLKTPPVLNNEGNKKAGSVVETLEQHGAQDEALALSVCLQTAQTLQAGELALCKFNLGQIQFRDVLTSVKNISACSPIHEFDLPTALSKQILDFESNSALALSEREHRQQADISRLNLEIDNFRTKEVEAARVSELLITTQ